MATSKSVPALNLASAALAGAVTLVRPARFPRWARRGLVWANTAGTAGSVFLTVRNRDDLPPEHPLHRAVSSSDLIAAATGGLMLVTSGIGLKADDKIEQFLVKRGFKHPRVWMAVGVVGVVFLAKTLQDAGSKKAEAMREQFKSAEQDEKTAIGKTDATINRNIADGTR
ncbi:hypothetical protein HJ588_06180 [Flexivirga sp. ID2601S]|uniref:DUF4235 domain-containing protein n=1 Tax=Flexivirga aerilata TaxID=1656889 RepID=A0A849AKE1_9MICO|nr:hypothetical protein [Flexivirga aerilata]NNG38860.1 hypothetical protein [Flexivirga aerilata]